jgi:hypothetical protein
MRYRRVKDPEYCRIIEGLAPRLTKLGFRRRRESWYRYNRQVVQLVDVRLGHNSHGLRLGLTIRRLNRTTHPSYVECHVRAGLQWLLPREEELVFNAARDLRTPEIDVENMVTVFWRCIQDRVLPILDSTRVIGLIWLRAVSPIQCITPQYPGFGDDPLDLKPSPEI